MNASDFLAELEDLEFDAVNGNDLRFGWLRLVPVAVLKEIDQAFSWWDERSPLNTAAREVYDAICAEFTRRENKR